MGSWKAWKQKASAWLKRALIITLIVIAVAVGGYVAWTAFIGARKRALRSQIASLQAEIDTSAGGAGVGSSGLSPVLEALLIRQLSQSPKVGA